MFRSIARATRTRLRTLPPIILSNAATKRLALSGIFNLTDFMRDGVIRTFNANRILSGPHCWQHFHPKHLQFLFIAFRLIRIAPRAFTSCISS